jgi:hypothetical protein
VRRFAYLTATVLILACGHSDPFGTQRPVEDGPFSGAQPIRLTYNIGADEWPAWTADGTTIYYSTQDSFKLDPRGVFPETDQCIARIPAGGGSRTDVACPLTPTSNDTTEILEQPAPLGSQLAYAVSELGVKEHSPYRFSLWMTTTTPFAAAQKLLQFPYAAPSGKSHDAPLNLQWLRPGVLLYLGAENGCCLKDTSRFGEQAVLLDVSVTPPVKNFIPGTSKASAVSASHDGASIYYTFPGDSMVYARDLATGTVTVVHNFGTGHIVRDPSVAGTRLVAVVDGQPGYRDIPPFDSVQVDHGGLLVIVDLATGTESGLPDYGLMYKRPVFSPDGSRFVAEGFPYVATGIPPDPVVSRWADLYLFSE